MARTKKTPRTLSVAFQLCAARPTALSQPGEKVQEAVKKTKETAKKATTAVKKTAVKKTAGTTTTKKGNTTVKRTPVVKKAPDAVETKDEDKEFQLGDIPEGSQKTEALDDTVTDEQVADAAAIVQGAANLEEGDKVVEKVTTITTTVAVHTEQHEVPADQQKAD